MNTRSSKYWEQRSLKRLAQAEKTSIPYLKQVQKIYSVSARSTVESVRAMYRAYYKGDKSFDMAALNMIAPQGDIRRFLREMEAKGLSTYLPQQYKGRMTRLELLNAQMWAESKKIGLSEKLSTTELYKKVYNMGYYQAGFDTIKGLGENIVFSKLDTATVQKVLDTKFEGKDFSQRIWTNTDHLADSLKDILAKAIATGQPLERTSMELRERFAVGTSNANRLIRTETCYFENNAELAAYVEMGIEEFVFMATLDSRTSDICQHMDGKRFKMTKAQIGENVPPLHPNCRSTIRAFIGDEYEPETRIARDPNTGKNYNIKNMTYSDWKASLDNAVEVKIKEVKATKPTTNAVVDKTTKTIPDSVRKEAIDTINSLANKFPQMKDHFKEQDTIIVNTNIGPRATARYRHYFDRKGTSFELSTYQLKDPKKLEAGFKRSLTNNWNMPSKASCVEYSISHEFGHAIENKLMSDFKATDPTYPKIIARVKAYQARTVEKPSTYSYNLSMMKKLINRYEERFSNSVANELIEIAKEKNPEFDLSANISKYGRTNSSELFAESFANSQCGAPNELGYAMIELLKRKGF